MPMAFKNHFIAKQVPSNCIMLSKLHFSFFIVLFHYIFLYPSTYALPITSKPIESTAENLAWEACVMLPPSQQNQEKARKVTPKSIFVFQHKKNPICQPNEVLHESQCLPIIEVNREDHLLAHIYNLFEANEEGGDSETNYNYDYELEEEENVSNLDNENNQPAELQFHKRYEGTNNSPDEPLKFNIFTDNFPTDVVSEHSKDVIDSENSTNIVGNNENVNWKQKELHKGNITIFNNTIDISKGTDSPLSVAETTSISTGLYTEYTTYLSEVSRNKTSDTSAALNENVTNKKYFFLEDEISTKPGIEIYSEETEKQINLTQLLQGESLIPSEETKTSKALESKDEEEEETTITTIISEVESPVNIDTTTNKLKGLLQKIDENVKEVKNKNVKMSSHIKDLNPFSIETSQDYSTETTNINTEPDETTLAKQPIHVELEAMKGENSFFHHDVQKKWKVESTELPIETVQHNRYYYKHMGIDHSESPVNVSNVDNKYETLANASQDLNLNETNKISLPMLSPITTFNFTNNMELISSSTAKAESVTSSAPKKIDVKNVVESNKLKEIEVVLSTETGNSINSKISAETIEKELELEQTSISSMVTVSSSTDLPTTLAPFASKLLLSTFASTLSISTILSPTLSTSSTPSTLSISTSSTSPKLSTTSMLSKTPTQIMLTTLLNTSTASPLSLSTMSMISSSSLPQTSVTSNNVISVESKVLSSSNISRDVGRNSSGVSNTKRSSENIETDRFLNNIHIPTSSMPISIATTTPETFWWLPSGWQWGSSEQTLLQRFWSAFQGEKTKAK